MISKLELVPDWLAEAKLAGYRPKLLADNLNVGLRQLENYFHRCGLNAPEKWLSELRTLRAAETLLTRDHPKNFLPDLGIRDAAQLCHDFRTWFGCTAREFLRDATAVNLNRDKTRSMMEKIARVLLEKRIRGLVKPLRSPFQCGTVRPANSPNPSE